MLEVRAPLQCLEEVAFLTVKESEILDVARRIVFDRARSFYPRQPCEPIKLKHNATC